MTAADREVYPDLEFEFAYISIYNYGPWVNGVLNTPSSIDDSNGPMVLNYGYRSKDMYLTENFLRGLFEHL